MKIMGAVLILGVFVWCGFNISNTMKKRCELLGAFITALEILKSEIAFNGADLKTAFNHAAKLSGADIFADSARYIESEGIAAAWKRAVENKDINEQDRRVFMLLSSKLGKTDAQGQIRHIDYVGGLAREARKNAAELYEKNGTLFMRGGVLLGIFAVLMLM